MIEQRKNFIVNSVYVALWGFMIFIIVKFTLDHLMPFVVGFLIAFLLKPIVRKLDEKFGKNKWVSILVTVLFYSLVLVVLTWAIFSLAALVQYYIPIGQIFVEDTLIPMGNELLAWFENIIGNLDPKASALFERGFQEVMNAFESIVNFVSKGALAWVTALVSSTPRLLVAIILSVISSFFFSMDYEEIRDNMLKLMPENSRPVVMGIVQDFVSLIKRYFVIYGKLLSVTFVELTIGFLILRVSSPLPLALGVAFLDILPVLGTGTVLIPWFVYELVIGSPRLALGLIILYAVITTVRYALEPRIIGKEMGIHPLLTLVSIYIGLKFFGFMGLFIFPIMVTIVVNMHKDNRFNFASFFKGEVSDSNVSGDPQN